MKVVGVKDRVAGFFGKAAASSTPVGSTAQAVGTGAKLGVGAAAAGAVLNAGTAAAKEWGFYLFLGGLMFWFLKFLGIDQYGQVLVILAWLLFFLSVPVVLKAGESAKERISWGYPLVFFIWYYIYSGTISNESLMTLLLFAGVIAIFDLLVRRVKAFKDFFSAVIMVAFFFLEVGLLPALFLNFGWTMDTFATTMFFFVPWWAYLGLFNTKTDNFILKALKVIGVVYVFLLLIFSVPTIQESNALPGTEDLLAQQELLRERLPDGEPIVWSRIKCLGETISSATSLSPENTEDCVTRLQLTSQLKIACEENMASGAWQYSSTDECVEAKLKEKEDATAVTGTINRQVVEYTTATLTSTEGAEAGGLSSRTVERSFKVGQAMQPFRMKLNIQNPYEQNIQGLITCTFRKGTEEVPGFIVSKDVFSAVTKTIETSILCSPLPTKEAEYEQYRQVTFNVDLSGLSTISTLQRMFVSTFDLQNPLLQDAFYRYFPTGFATSSSPEEFARLNFAFGEPETSPVVEEDDQLLFVSSIENVGQGKITSVDGFIVDLDQYGLYPAGDSPGDTCLYGDGSSALSLDTLGSGGVEPMSFCFLSHSADISNELSAQPFVIKTFRGQLDYSYQISAQQNIHIKHVGPEPIPEPIVEEEEPFANA